MSKVLINGLLLIVFCFLLASCGSDNQNNQQSKEPLRLNIQLAPAYIDDPFNVTLNADGGVRPYRYIMDGSLPKGLSYADGRISGTPQEKGTYDLTFTVEDSNLSSRVQKATLSVGDTPPPQLEVKYPLAEVDAPFVYAFNIRARESKGFQLQIPVKDLKPTLDSLKANDSLLYVVRYDEAKGLVDIDAVFVQPRRDLEAFRLNFAPLEGKKVRPQTSFAASKIVLFDRKAQIVAGSPSIERSPSQGKYKFSDLQAIALNWGKKTGEATPAPSTQPQDKGNTPQTPAKDQPKQPTQGQPTQPTPDQPATPAPDTQPKPDNSTATPPAKDQPAQGQPSQPAQDQPEQPKQDQTAQPTPTPDQPSQPAQGQPSQPVQGQPSQPVQEQPSPPTQEQQTAEPQPEQPQDPQSPTEAPKEPDTEAPKDAATPEATPTETKTEAPTNTDPATPTQTPAQPTDPAKASATDTKTPVEPAKDAAATPQTPAAQTQPTPTPAKTDTPTKTATGLEGDLNGDGTVDQKDLEALRASYAWGNVVGTAPAQNQPNNRNPQNPNNPTTPATPPTKPPTNPDDETPPET